jgi:hypothetical protein
MFKVGCRRLEVRTLFMPLSGTTPDDVPRQLSEEVPAWALRYAEAALSCGMKTAEIEAHLVEKGLLPALAASAVPIYFEERLQTVKKSKKNAARLRAISLAGSLIIATFHLAVFSFIKGAEGFVRCLLYLLLPMGCIWFSEAFGRYIGRSGLLGPYITHPTPAVFVAIGGWLLLVAPLAAVLILIFW